MIPNTIKLLELVMGENFPDIKLGNDFLAITPDMQATKQIDK